MSSGNFDWPMLRSPWPMGVQHHRRTERNMESDPLSPISQCFGRQRNSAALLRLLGFMPESRGQRRLLRIIAGEA